MWKWTKCTKNEIDISSIQIQLGIVGDMKKSFLNSETNETLWYFVVCLKNDHFWGPRAANSIFFKTKEFDPLKWLNDEAMENYKLREHVFLKVNTRKSCKLPVRLDNNRIIWQNRPNTLLEIVCWQIGQGGDLLRRSPSCVWNGNVLSARQRIRESLFYRIFFMPWRLNQSHFLLLKPGLKVSHLMLSI